MFYYGNNYIVYGIKPGGNNIPVIVSLTPFQRHEALEMSPEDNFKDGIDVGTHCRLAMGSVKALKELETCDEDCFCYDANLTLYSHQVECYVQGTYV